MGTLDRDVGIRGRVLAGAVGGNWLLLRSRRLAPFDEVPGSRSPAALAESVYGTSASHERTPPLCGHRNAAPRNRSSSSNPTAPASPISPTSIPAQASQRPQHQLTHPASPPPIMMFINPDPLSPHPGPLTRLSTFPLPGPMPTPMHSR